MLQIACVLKSGGDYDWDYVTELYKSISTKLSYDFEFCVFTDMYKEGDDLIEIEFAQNVEIISLKTPLESYWSKLEVFFLTGEVIYFDLDTIILSNMDNFIEKMRGFCKYIYNDVFFMMSAFSPSRLFSSGIMAWNGDHRHIITKLPEDYKDIYGKWEQDYILDAVRGTASDVYSLSTLGTKIVSFKHHCKDGAPKDADIVCFHGKPRPREIGWQI